MNGMRVLLILCLSGAMLCGLATGPAMGTVLDANGTGFDRLIPPGSPQVQVSDRGLLDDWGSVNASGISSYNTPNVTVQWPDMDRVPDNGLTDHYHTHDDQIKWTPNDLYPVPGWPNQTDDVTFTADPGYLVWIESLDIVGIKSGLVNISVDGSSPYSFAFSGNATIDTGLTGLGSQITLHYASLYNVKDISMDNIVFSQTPEPSSMVLLTLAMLGLLGYRLRSRRRP